MRVNKGGNLKTLAYGNPCAVNVDPVEKKPLYHFLPGTRAFSVATAGCNLNCLNCQNWEISQSSPDKTRNYNMPPDEVIAMAEKYQCQSIAYTYTEPVVFVEYMMDTAKLARKKNIKNLMISAGYIKEKPLIDLCKVIDAANIDLKGFDNELYKKLNSGILEPVLNTLKILKENHVHLEITNLLVPGWTDDMKMIRKMCKWLLKNGFENIPLHLSRFYPMYRLKNLPSTPIKVLQNACAIAKQEGLNNIFIGNVAEIDASNTVCPKCGEMLVKRKGYKVKFNNINNSHCPNCKAEIYGVWK